MGCAICQHAPKHDQILTIIRNQLATLPTQLRCHVPRRTPTVWTCSTYPSAILSPYVRNIALVRPSEIPNTRSMLLRSPTIEDLEEQELDVDLIPTNQLKVVLTDRAAEVLPSRTHVQVTN